MDDNAQQTVDKHVVLTALRTLSSEHRQVSPTLHASGGQFSSLTGAPGGAAA